MVLVESPTEDQGRVCEQEKDFPPPPKEIVEQANNATYYFTDNDGTTAEKWLAILASQYEHLAAIGTQMPWPRCARRCRLNRN